MANFQKRCEVMVKGEYIQEVYSWYEEQMLVVNRKYQRKLVWTLEEKQQFIDTIMRNYPVPLFLVVNNPNIKGKNGLSQKEIIDGLQRLESIISFINNKYPITFEGNHGYFNLDVLPGKGQLIRDGKLNQRKPILDFKLCTDFVKYQLPISTIETNDAEVENIFKRINSTGRKLSSQNLRQAGVTGLFNDLVYKTSAKIRGDYTEDNIIKLNDISRYSLNSRGLNYGIKVQDVFWINQGIITEDGIRRSKDEEIIANLYNCIINNYKTSISTRTLNNIYDESTFSYRKNEEMLFGGRDKELMELFITIFNDFNEIFNQKHLTFSELISKKHKVYNKDLVFIIVFLAFIQLRNEHYVIEDYLKVGNKLENIADIELNEIIFKSDCPWSTKIRNHLIERVKNCLIKSMVFKETKPEWSQEVIDILKRAETEEQMYDFKMGITNLSDGRLNQDVIPKCVKTLTAMANTHIGKDGFIIIGVSDKSNDAKDFEKHYSVEIPKYNNYYVNGIKDEAIKYYGSIEKYLNTIKNAIQNEDKNIDGTALHYILSNMKVIKYNEQAIIVLKLKSDRTLFYKQEFFVRHQSSNKKIKIGSSEFYDILVVAEK